MKFNSVQGNRIFSHNHIHCVAVAFFFLHSSKAHFRILIPKQGRHRTSKQMNGSNKKKEDLLEQDKIKVMCRHLQLMVLTSVNAKILHVNIVIVVFYLYVSMFFFRITAFKIANNTQLCTLSCKIVN